MEPKNEIRKRILTLLRTQKEEDRFKRSGIIREKLFNLPEFQHAHSILLYVSFDGEVDTFEIMKQASQIKKKIVLPITDKEAKKIIPRVVENLEEGLDTGPYGIKQPKLEQSVAIDEGELDLVIVPGVVFDTKNNRLGRGEGYYDRFLGSLPSNIPTIGLAFDFQIINELPHEEHDIPVSKVLTN